MHTRYGNRLRLLYQRGVNKNENMTHKGTNCRPQTNPSPAGPDEVAGMEALVRNTQIIHVETTLDQRDLRAVTTVCASKDFAADQYVLALRRRARLPSASAIIGNLIEGEGRARRDDPSFSTSHGCVHVQIDACSSTYDLIDTRGPSVNTTRTPWKEKECCSHNIEQTNSVFILR